MNVEPHHRVAQTQQNLLEKRRFLAAEVPLSLLFRLPVLEIPCSRKQGKHTVMPVLQQKLCVQDELKG